MQEYLIEDAVHKVWCNPYQDNQHVLKPEKVTTGAGALNTAFALGRQIPLPIRNYRTQMYQVGQYSPSLLGLLERWPSWSAEKWFSLEEAMNQLPLYANAYNNKGANIPRANVYFMMTREKCLMFAVLCDPRIQVDYGNEPVFFRVYTSAYLKGSYRTGSAPFIEVKSTVVNTNAEIAAQVSEFASMKARPGLCEAFVNGWWVAELNGLTVKLGDIVELVYDATVKRVVNWKIRNLKPFTSTLDTKFKYILHYSKSTTVTQIEFYDDIDIYIHYKTDQFGDRGRYYHKNLPDAMRMLTHRDYSITTDYVNYVAAGIAQDLGLEASDYLEFEINMKVRRNDFNRPLIKDPNKIFELYKLSDTRILMAMSGVNSVVPPWYAANLEASAYCRFMGALNDEIDIKLVQDAYGYDYTSQVLGNSPLPVVKPNLVRVVQLPYGLASGATMYELDANGSLLGSYLHNTNDNDYEPRTASCTSVEAIMGLGTHRPDIQYGENNLAITPNCDYRLYRCRKNFDVTPPTPDFKWEDITGDATLYKVEDGKVVWISPENDQFLMLKTNSNFLSYSFSAVATEGLMLFELTEISTLLGVTEERPMMVPGGDLQIWLNGRNLVMGIDYIVQFPYICINNYNFFLQPTNTVKQFVTIRSTGFCTKDLQFHKPKAVGFVENGAISKDGKYDIHDDKVMHISVNGMVRSPNQVKFYEDKPTWEPNSPVNGTPYQVVNMAVPLRSFTEAGTYPLLDKARAVDAMAEAYMKLYYAWPTNEPISVALERWKLVSPFFSHLIELCVTKQLVFQDFDDLSATRVREICKPYESLMQFDPVYIDNNLPTTYVNIVPHHRASVINVTRPQYRFLQMAVELYGQGLVGLNNFVTFTI